TMQPDSAARPVVGRDHELSRITATISSGRPHDPAPVVLVVGEAGLGKTVLLDEVAGTLPAGTRVLRMSGDEAEADTDFTLVDQVIGDLTPRSPALAAAGGTTALDVGARLLRLTNALEPDQAVVLLLDDAQVADISSLHALTFFLRRVPGDRVAMVLATRPDGLPRLPPGLLRAAERTGGTIELGGLPLDAVGELAAAARVEPVPASIVARVHEVTGGHPLHARILLEQPDLSALADGGDLGQLPTLSS